MAVKNNLQEILSDLYALDPSLRAREEDLIPLIEKLIKSKPRTAFNQVFAAELRQKLLSEAGEFGKNNNMKKERASRFKIDWRVISYASVGTAALVLVAVVASSMMVYKQNNLVAKHQAPTLKNQIVKVSRNAFGTLALAKNANGGNLVSQQNSGSSPSAPAVAESAGSNGAAISARAPMGMGGGGAGAVSSKMMADASYIMPPNYGTIKYVYTGDDFTPPSGLITVYKKLPPASSDFSSVLAAVGGLNTGLIDVGQLKDLKLDSFNIKEDREFGYYLGFSSGNYMYMSKNWEKWPNPTAQCQDDKCWQDNRVKLSDMISDEELVSIADGFIKEYKVNLEGYGPGVVNNQWRVAYEASADKANYYFPEEAYVVYPMLIEGQEVRGQGGELQGLAVTVDIRNRKASGFNGSLLPSFEASEYESIADKDQVLKIAQEGGLNGLYYYGAENGQESVVELGTPKLILLQYWQYNQTAGQGEDLYMPAYMFPLKSKPRDSYMYIDNIVVPLVKDAINQVDRPMLLKGGEATVSPEPAPAPMPMVKSTEVRPE